MLTPIVKQEPLGFRPALIYTENGESIEAVIEQPLVWHDDRIAITDSNGYYETFVEAERAALNHIRAMLYALFVTRWKFHCKEDHGVAPTRKECLTALYSWVKHVGDLPDSQAALFMFLDFLKNENHLFN
jgi:hypothetical protein